MNSYSHWRLGPVITALVAVATVACTLSACASMALGQQRGSRAYPPTMKGASEVAVYKTIDDTDLKLYIFQPDGNQSGKQTPAIVFFFGGAWRTGSPEQWHRQCLYFSSRGMVAIAVDYRVRSRNNTTPLDAVRDAKSSIRWLRQNAQRLGIDASRIVASGGSAGGHLAAAVGIIEGLDEADENLTVSSKANALVLYNPAVVMAPVEGTNLGRRRGRTSNQDRQAISPFHHVTKGDPPTIVFHGKQDQTIPYATVEAFTNKMLETGNRCELVLFDEARHGFFNSGNYYPNVLAQTDKFLVSLGYLEGEPTVQADPTPSDSEQAAQVSQQESATTAKPVGRPNILFIFSDDHAYQAISAYGSIINQTPNIDRIAKRGLRFDRAYVTNSICGPMRAVILTGKYSHLNDFFRNGNRFDGMQQSFPRLLQGVGYQTAVIGKWHLGQHQVPQGFDYSEVLIGQGSYYNPAMLKNGERVNHTGYTTDVITDLALNWLKQARDPDRPFMLMYQHKAPHRSWEPGPHHLTMYDDITIPEPDTLFDDYSGRGTPAHTQDMTIAETMNNRDLKLTAPRNLTPEQRAAWDAAYGPKNEAFRKANLEGEDLVRWKYQRYIKDYLRCIASVDDNVGRMLDYLDEAGLADNTIVIYCSDQGFYLGEHGWFDKRWMYEQSLRTPLLVKWPGVTEPGSVNSQDIVSPLDFAETFLEVAGVDIPADMQGRSLVPVLKGQTPDDWRKTFYYHYYEFPGAHSVRRHYGVTDGRFKLIHFYEEDVNEWELFDLQTDPNEMKSVYADPEYADARARMESELARLRKDLQETDEDPPDSFRRRRGRRAGGRGGQERAGGRGGR